MATIITGDTPVYQLSVNQLLTIINSQPEVKEEPLKAKNEPRLVYGLSGLASLLNCSLPTAQKLKNSGTVPFKQAGRKIVFDVEAVLRAIEKQPKKKRA